MLTPISVNPDQLPEGQELLAPPDAVLPGEPLAAVSSIVAQGDPLGQASSAAIRDHRVSDGELVGRSEPTPDCWPGPGSPGQMMEDGDGPIRTT